MKSLNLLLVCLMTFMALSVNAQTEQPQKEISNAKVIIKNGQETLVLKDKIELNMDTKLWRALDSLTTASWGGNGVQLKDIKGYNVLAQRGRINDKNGLIFTSGTMCVAITKEEFDKLRYSYL